LYSPGPVAISYNLMFYNNAIYNSDEGTLVLTGENHRNITIFNNLVSTNGSNSFFVSYYLGSAFPLFADYNNFYGTGYWRLNGTDYTNLTLWANATGLDNNSITTDPSFVNPGGRNSSDYKLNSSSPAINAGIDRQDYNNNGNTTELINIGAYITGNETIGVLNPVNYDPFVFLESVSNNYNSTNTTVDFKCFVSDDYLLKNVTLYGNWTGSWSANETINMSEDNTTTFTKTLAEGTYIWNCLAYDNNSNSDWGSSNYTLTITAGADTTYPTFSAFSQTPQNNSNYSSGAAYQFNTTIANTNTTAGLEFNGANYTSSNSSSVFNATVSDLAEGTYFYYWWAYGNGTKQLQCFKYFKLHRR